MRWFTRKIQGRRLLSRKVALVDLMNFIGREFKPRLVRFPTFSDANLSKLKMPVLVIVGGGDVLRDAAEIRRSLEQAAPYPPHNVHQRALV